jgi:TolB protein
LALVAARREIAGLYGQAGAAEKAGDYASALELYTQVTVRSPGYLDTTQRIVAIKKRLEQDRLFAQAEADAAAGRFAGALQAYQQIQALDATYKREVIDGRLFNIELRLGQDIVALRPPDLQRLPEAVDLFARALTLKPDSDQARLEHELATLYVQGRAAYEGGRWEEAVSRLRGAYDQRPDYLGGALIAPLYDAYLRLGDGYRDNQDFPLAWEQYRRASELPGVDVTAARARMEAVAAYMTPTPTPTNTPTATPYPTPAPPPGPAPTATPPAPLVTYRGQIVFWTDREDQPGLWVMMPDGTNRRYLGNSSDLRKQYEALYQREQFSPDGKLRVYATSDQSETTQIWMQGQPDAKGHAYTRRVTNLSKLAYDPVWSPDGSLIAFVSTERGSDDIWTIQVDGNEPWDRTPNVWEWDKHPSWSPDSLYLVFWTNREGTKQIYIMDRDGKNQHNISKVAWDEYDPIWVK